MLERRPNRELARSILLLLRLRLANSALRPSWHREGRFIRMMVRRALILSTLLGTGVAGVEVSRGENPPAAPPVVTADMKDGRVVFQNVCAACHGANGEGKAELKSPAIAGLPEWYAKPQIKGFQEGRRGHDPADAQAFMMAAIAKSLSAEQIEAVVAHTAKLPVATPADIDRSPANADIAEGQLLFQERCMECHRYNASGEMAFGSPPLVGQQAWYIKAQIHKFKTGGRGTVKGDVNGAKMVLSSNFIEDDKMLNDIVAYILTLNPEPESAEPKSEESSPFEAASK